MLSYPSRFSAWCCLLGRSVCSFPPALFATGRPRRSVENNAATLAGVALGLLVGVQWGVVGLCAGWLAGYVPVFCAVASRSLVMLQIPLGRAVAAMATPLGAGLDRKSTRLNSSHVAIS